MPSQRSFSHLKVVTTPKKSVGFCLFHPPQVWSCAALLKGPESFHFILPTFLPEKKKKQLDINSRSCSKKKSSTTNWLDSVNCLLSGISAAQKNPQQNGTNWIVSSHVWKLHPPSYSGSNALFSVTFLDNHIRKHALCWRDYDYMHVGTPLTAESPVLN